jgi:hypothetical protein
VAGGGAVARCVRAGSVARPTLVLVILAAIGIAGLVSTTGCSRRPRGPTRHAVSGRITFAGQPVPAGRITFEPDMTAGNAGPGGYGEIKAGRYTTYPDMGTVGGPHIVIITGFDGVPVGELVDGRPLFREYRTTADLPPRQTTVDFEVPARK